MHMTFGRVLAMGCAAVALLGACGDDDDDAVDGTTIEEGADPVVLAVADFTGAAEVPGPGQEGAGGTVERLEIVGSDLCTRFAVSGLDSPAVAAHLHDGGSTEAGPVVVNLGDPADAAAGSWDTCVPIDDATKAAVTADPAGYYLNVHTATFPDGAARAQLAAG